MEQQNIDLVFHHAVPLSKQLTQSKHLTQIGGVWIYGNNYWVSQLLTLSQLLRQISCGTKDKVH